MCNNAQTAASMTVGHDCVHNTAGDVMPPIDIIRAAIAAADIIKVPLDAIEYDMSKLRKEWKNSASIPTSIVAHYAEAVQSFVCIINDYRFSIENALEQIERTYLD